MKSGPSLNRETESDTQYISTSPEMTYWLPECRQVVIKKPMDGSEGFPEYFEEGGLQVGQYSSHFITSSPSSPLVWGCFEKRLYCVLEGEKQVTMSIRLHVERGETTPTYVCTFHLPVDLIVEILSRLPVKFLLRFSIVCKTWKSKAPISFPSTSNNTH